MIQVLKRFAKEREIQQQLERDMRIREARRRYEKFIVTEERRNERLHKLAVEAHMVGSHALRDKLAQIISQTDANVKLWKERMVYFEMMQEVMSQAQACANFAEAFHSMAQSIVSAANPADLARIQTDMQKSILFADQLNEMTEQMVEVMDGELEGADAASHIDPASVLKRIVSEAEGKQSDIDREIDGLLKEIAAAKEQPPAENAMGRSVLDQVRMLVSQGRQFQLGQSWKEARTCYLSAAELMLRVAEDSDDKAKALWLSRAKSLRQAATKLEDVIAAANGHASPLLEETHGAGNEPWLVAEYPQVNFKDVAGYEAVKKEISLTLLYPFSHAEAADYYKIQGGGGIILYGPPGVGKTHFSRAVAGELGLPFFWVKSSDILSKYVGEAEQNIARLFAAARRNQRAVILIDEVEKLMPSRSETVSSVMPRVVGQLLEETNGFAGQTNMLLLIGNTNVPWLIDEAFLNPRRFGRQIYIPLPDAPAREQIMQIHLQQVPYDGSIRLKDFAARLEGYSGADIAQVCYRARSIPFLEVVHGGRARPLNERDINGAIAQAEPTVSPAAVRRFEEYAHNRAEAANVVA